jgi:pentatricopeptide repeat protein
MVIQALCRDGKAEAAAEILRLMVSGIKSNTNSFYLSIVRRVAKSGRIEEAERLHRELIDCKVLPLESHFLENIS